MKDNNTMTYDVSKDEAALFESAKKHMTALKGNIKDLYEIQMKAGRGDAAHAAFACLTAINVAHVECGDRLMECFPDAGNDIVLRGGGGR